MSELPPLARPRTRTLSNLRTTPGSRPMLTGRQEQVLSYLTERHQRGEGSPTFDEIAQALDLKSRSGVHRMIRGLEERGFIRRLAHRSRAIELTPRALGTADAAPVGWGSLFAKVLGAVEEYREGRDQRLEPRCELGDQLVDLIDAARQARATQ